MIAGEPGGQPAVDTASGPGPALAMEPIPGLAPGPGQEPGADPLADRPNPDPSLTASPDPGGAGERSAAPARTVAVLAGGLAFAWRLLWGAALVAALVSVLAVGVLRWVDPPASAFMLRQAWVGWRSGRPPPYFHHRWVAWREMPAVVPLAAIAAEDQRFPRHHGFDSVEIRRALAAWRRGGALRGASTISQQTAKNLFLWPGRSWTRKALEAWLAASIELLWPKKRILEVYLNIVQLSPNTYGVGAASERYFKRPVGELTLREASLLAGVLPAPGAYRLDRPSPRLERRARWIADQTLRLGGVGYLDRL